MHNALAHFQSSAKIGRNLTLCRRDRTWTASGDIVRFVWKLPPHQQHVMGETYAEHDERDKLLQLHEESISSKTGPQNAVFVSIDEFIIKISLHNNPLA